MFNKITKRLLTNGTTKTSNVKKRLYILGHISYFLLESLKFLSLIIPEVFHFLHGEISGQIFIRLFVKRQKCFNHADLWTNIQF